MPRPGRGYAPLGGRGQDKDQGFLMVLVTPVETIVCLSNTYFQMPRLKDYETDVTVPGLASKRAANIFGISGRRSSILFDRALRIRIRN